MIPSPNEFQPCISRLDRDAPGKSNSRLIQLAQPAAFQQMLDAFCYMFGPGEIPKYDGQIANCDFPLEWCKFAC